LSFNNFGTGGGLRKIMDSSKRLVAAGSVDSNIRQSGLGGKEGGTKDDAEDYVTKALNPFGKSHVSGSFRRAIQYGTKIAQFKGI
jgi:hypothetical protein